MQYLRLFFVFIAHTYLKKKKKKAYLKEFFAVDTAVVVQMFSADKNPPVSERRSFIVPGSPAAISALISCGFITAIMAQPD